jgi:3-dehydroquinate synthase
VQVGLLPAGQEERIYSLLKRLGFYLWHPAMESRDAAGSMQILGGLQDFREHLGGELTVTLLREVGRGEDVHSMDEQEIMRAMTWLRRKETGR